MDESYEALLKKIRISKCVINNEQLRSLFINKFTLVILVSLNSAQRPRPTCNQSRCRKEKKHSSIYGEVLRVLQIWCYTRNSFINSYT